MGRIEERLKKQIEVYKEKLAAHPQDEVLHFNLGEAYVQLGEDDLAQAQIILLKDLNPDLADQLVQSMEE